MKDKFDIDFDVRVVERNIRDNKVTRKAYNDQLEALKDISELAEPLVIEDETQETEDEAQEAEDENTETTESSLEQPQDGEGEQE